MGRLAPRWILCLTLLLTLSAAVLSPTLSSAQDTAPTPPPDSEPIRGDLVQAVLQELPANPALIRVIRLVLQPGASVPLHSHPGPEFGWVESGVLTVGVEGEVVIAQGTIAGTPQPPRVPPIGQDFDLLPGHQIIYPAGVPLSLSNRTADPVSVITAIILPASPGSPPSSEWLEGIPRAVDDYWQFRAQLAEQPDRKSVV